jgi:hypothetical protein
VTEFKWVKVTNGCSDVITVYLRYPRPKKRFSKRRGHFKLRPAEESNPLPYPYLIGAKDWDALRRRRCVTVEEVSYRPEYVELLNLSPTPITVAIKTKKQRALLLEPDKPSRRVARKALAKPATLQKLVRARQIALIPVWEIGPATSERSVGSYEDDRVYTCDECGGPIVFRGSPPVPIHI